MSEYLKFDYLKNEMSFGIEIKTFFLVLQVVFFRHKKQTSKNVADTTFKDIINPHICLLKMANFSVKTNNE